MKRKTIMQTCFILTKRRILQTAGPWGAFNIDEESHIAANLGGFKTMRLFGEKFSRIVYWFVLASFVVPIVFLVYRIAVTTDANLGEVGFRSRADYSLMLVQCLLGAVVIHAPHFLQKHFKVEIPPLLLIMYIIFLYCAIFLGEVRSFYYRIPHWDKWLHGFSAVMAGFLGFILVDEINKSSRIGLTLSPVFTALFAFYFAVSVGVLWEVYEYAFDGILGLNMQKFMLEDGTQLIGRAALNDTMKDIIIDCCGSLIASITGCILLIRQKEKRPGTSRTLRPQKPAADTRLKR